LRTIDLLTSNSGVLEVVNQEAPPTDAAHAAENEGPPVGLAPPKDIFTHVIGLLRGHNFRAKSLAPLTDGFSRRLIEFGAEEDILNLEKQGVRRETLAVGATFFCFATAIEQVARTAFGNMRERKRKSKTLYEAIEVLSGFQRADPSPDRNELPKSVSPSLTSTAEDLRVYAETLFFREQVLKALNANSGLEISKYAIASAIDRITGKYYDRHVSGIVGALLGQSDYDETSHRVWRIRTLPRLNKTTYVLPTILHALNSFLVETSSSQE
jgi:hypothetical protein